MNGGEPGADPNQSAGGLATGVGGPRPDESRVVAGGMKW